MNKWLRIILGMIGVGIISFLFYSSFLKRSSSRELISGNSPTRSESSPTTSVTENNDVTINWDNYVSEAYGFSIDHPPEVKAVNKDENSIVFSYTPDDTNSENSRDILSISSDSLGEISIFQFSTDQADARRTLPDIKSVSDPEEISVSDKTAYKFDVKTSRDEFRHYYVDKGQNSYLLIIDMTLNTDDQMKDTARRMIDTLRITDPSS